jgi:DNA polymerase-3 subunit delta
MEFGDIVHNLKKGIYHPIYLLQGEEPYFIDELSNYIEKNVLSDAEKGFNQTIFYGKDSDAITIAESAMRFPMMASKQVIIVKEAQSLNKIETLLSYAQNPLESTILVLAYKYKSIKGNTKLAKAINKNGVVFTSKKLYENKIPAWIDSYLKKHGYSITPQAALLLTSYLGTDLSKIANELEKLVIAVKESNKITPEHIEKNIGLSKDYNVLELQNALGEKNVLKANKIIQYFGSNPTLNPIQKTIAGLYFYFSKLFTYHFLKDKSERNVSAELRVHPFFVREYVSAAKRYSPTKLYEIMGILREYDMKSKGFNVSTMVETGDLQKEMIYKILH